MTESGAKQIIRKAINYCKSLSGEAVRYIIIGACTTLINFALFAVMTKWLKIGITVSNVTSISCAILFAYVTNKLIVFKNRCNTKTELAAEFTKFVGARLFTMALEIGAVALSVDVLHIDELIGKIGSQVLVIVANYVISKAIVFRRRKS